MATELKQRRNIIVLFEDCEIDWCWDESELNDLVAMNKYGYSLQEMCDYLKRYNLDEVFLALYYLAMKERIQKIDLEKLLRGTPKTIKNKGKRKKYGKLFLNKEQYIQYKKMNMTDKEIAEMLGVSLDTIKKWKRENGMSARRVRKSGG